MWKRNMASRSLSLQSIICCAAAISIEAAAFIPSGPLPITNKRGSFHNDKLFSSKTNNEFGNLQDVFDLQIIQSDDPSFAGRDIDGLSNSSPAAPFFDIESDYDEISIASPFLAVPLDDDEDRMLTEREDRLFLVNNTQKVESCILIGVEDLSKVRRNKKAARNSENLDADDFNLDFSLEESMIEMRELIKTAGLQLRGEITQRLQEINPKTYIGTGKVVEAQTLLGKINEDFEKEGASPCCTVVFDAELTPGQQKALENAFNKKVIENDFLGSDTVVKVVDRTALILDIFAQHAKTREGKLQVDLALHEYRKPRLTRMWTHLERQSGAGGVGLRGPGETQLEVDKRILRDRILVLKEKIDGVQKQRDLHRRSRKRGGLPVLALVGYTNAGKSTLLYCLTRAGILAEDILFATLDPTTRKVKLPGYKTHPEVLLTDTVGFIQKLPTQLVAAFRATLEEVREADVLVHIVDVSNSSWRKQEVSVNKVLQEIGAGDKPIVRVFNKLDLLNKEDAETIKCEAALSEGFAVGVSSLTGDGLGDFVAVVETALSGLLVPVELELPYSCGQEINLIHEVGIIETIDYREQGTYILGKVPRALAMKLDQYSIANVNSRRQLSESIDSVQDDIDWVALGKGRHEKENRTS
ncbi:hypothetical protein HJC23_009642 [Cyclotella cryptica]|uniref:Hflx-type G domain-containing protein n=1 Tax=Cyclotella cryptica TaxID=29204 RepID=A0ABD3PW29_9STRA|eukprot:CCRYP_010893-RA/>CCRYP_010893-RA protein AED:0.03 eAED:0.03 QI:687/1/1/1/1/1/3/3338/641